MKPRANQACSVSLASCLLFAAGCAFTPENRNDGTILLSLTNASCRIDLTGARILSYVQDGQEILWNDDPPQRTASDWAHGGIPICWPWFGVDADGRVHGKAWRRQFVSSREWRSNSSCGMELALQEGDFALTYDVTLREGHGLMLGTHVRNLGATNGVFTLGFHPYFRAQNRDEVVVSGLDGRNFEDDPSFPHPSKGVWRGPLCVTNYIDRIFELPTNAACVRVSGALPHTDIDLMCFNFNGLNVWNPGEEKNCPGVVPDDAWRRFVCVEPVRTGTADAVCLQPGQEVGFLFLIRAIKREP